MPAENPLPVCPRVLSVNGVTTSVSVLPARLADGSSRNGFAAPTRLPSGPGCSGSAFQFCGAVWPGENGRAESVWPPDGDENNWKYSVTHTSDGPAEKFWFSDWGSPNGKMSEEMRPTAWNPKMPSGSQPPIDPP